MTEQNQLARYITTIGVLEDQLDEVETWLPLIEATFEMELENAGISASESLADMARDLVETSRLYVALVEALATLDGNKMQHAQAAYKDCKFFNDPIDDTIKF